MDMRKELHIVASLALLVSRLPPVLTGCGKAERDPVKTVTVPLAFSVGRASEGLETKMAESIVQLNTAASPFRGIEQPHVIPFSISNPQGGIQSEDVRGGSNISVAGITGEFSNDAQKGKFRGLVNNNNAHLYSSTVIPNHTNAVLVYGKAVDATTDENSVPLVKDGLPFKQHNGVILFSSALDNAGTGTGKAKEIRFELEPFISTDALKMQFEKWKKANIDMLNEIASTSIDNQTVKLLDPSTYGDYAQLRTAFVEFTGGGRVFSGADATVGKILTDLYKNCGIVSSTGTSPAKELAAEVINVINGYTQDMTDPTDPTVVTRPAMLAINAGTVSLLSGGAPGTFGLPDGVSTLRWKGNAFDSPAKADGTNMASVDTYCFPPALWYYINSPLKGCKKSADVLGSYVNTKSWDDILAQYTQTEVGVDTDAAVITKPLQYAVAQLRMTLDRTGFNSAADCPLTGIIIGGQRSQQFDFSPIPSGSGGKEYFLYDSQVSDAATIYTLALETLPGEDIHFALEFRNAKTTDIYGVRGCVIRPGSKFYMVGTMSYSNLSASQKEIQASVFAKDHYTTLNVSFVNQSLYYCYDLLPELRSPDLQLGISAQLTWDAATPQTVPIK